MSRMTQTERTIHPVTACECSADFSPSALRIIAAGQKGRLGIDSITLGEQLTHDLVQDGLAYAMIVGENPRGEQHVLGGSAVDLGQADQVKHKVHRANAYKVANG